MALAAAQIVAAIATRITGLALAGASAISHDLYARVIKKGTASSAQEMKVTRFASVGLGLTAIALGIAWNLADAVDATAGAAVGVAQPAAGAPVRVEHRHAGRRAE